MTGFIMGTPLREDVANAKAKMTITWGSGREIRKLGEHLYKDETVEIMCSGKYSGGRGLIVLTDKRVFFIKNGWFGQDSQDFPFHSISSIEWKSKIFFGVIQLFSDGSQASIESVGRISGDKIVARIRQRVGRNTQPDSFGN